MFELLNLLKKLLKREELANTQLFINRMIITLFDCAICTLYYYTYCNTKLSILSIQEYD